MKLSQTRPALDHTTRTQTISTSNPKSTGHDAASLNPIPYIGTVKGTPKKAGRKVGQIYR